MNLTFFVEWYWQHEHIEQVISVLGDIIYGNMLDRTRTEGLNAGNNVSDFLFMS